jgi:ATP-binding cassette subfamily B protein/ATP-binding cassette subfamily C protein/ATP-binding cassette subfamily B multidrug efflux pump
LIVWIPRQIGHVVDGLVAGQLAHGALLRELAWLLGRRAVVYFLRVGWRLRLYAAAYRIGVELRERLYARLSLQGAAFYQHHRTGNLMALATNDVDAVEMAAGEAMLAGFDGTLTLVLVVGMMSLGVDWRLAACAILPFPLMALGFWRISRHVHAASRLSLERFGALNDHVQETLAGVRTVRALGLQARSEAQFGALAGGAAAASLDAQRWEAAYEPAVGCTFAAATMLVLGAGTWLVWHGELTVGQLTSFSLYLGQLVWPMFAAGWVLSLLERGKAAWARLQPVLEAPLGVEDRGTVPSVQPGTIALREVRFGYAPGARAALDRVSLVLPRGRTLGLVGPTGAGKTTLLKLLLRQHAPDAGELRWNEVPLPDYTLAALRAGIAWVPQEPFLFSAPVAENIALAKPGATRAEVERAAKLAAVHEDILRLPRGYDTPVGERGVTLSGGQRQRVAIARALLADAPLLLLDDALSAVDTETEARILAHLREARVGRTVVIVSHRLSAVVDADEVVVLRDGHIVEQGGHAALPRATAGTRASGATSNCRRASMPAESVDTPREGLVPAPRRRFPAQAASLLLRAALPERRHLWQGVLWLLAAAGLEALGPLAGKYLIDNYLLPRDADLPRIAGLLLGALFAGAVASWLRYLQLVRLAGVAMRSVQAPARAGVPARAAAAHGLLRPRHHGPAREPRHQRHRGGEDALRAGSVRDPGQPDPAGRRDDRHAVAGLAADADRGGAGAGGGADRGAVPAPVGAGGDAQPRAAQRAERARGRVDRGHGGSAGRQCGAPLPGALRLAQRRALPVAAGRAARQCLAAAAGAGLPQRGAAGGHPVGVRAARFQRVARRARGRHRLRVHQLHLARDRAADPDHHAVLAAAAGADRSVAGARPAGRNGSAGRARPGPREPGARSRSSA